MSRERVAAIILAAGKSTRMKSELPKVVHEICGRPMLAYVLDACRAAGVRQCCVVVGHGKDAVMSACADDHDIRWVEQTEQKGTGHAV
ncbi:MAG: NTP transferase domain-containing protein, partial [Planctomycetes bacterium]|nr:NTP transferase domain-containing protein [Planctomycetota bacterium]